MADEVRCPKCGSSQLTTKDKGFSLGKAAVGALWLGPVGLAAGMLGSKKTHIVCLKCGYEWEVGKR